MTKGKSHSCEVEPTRSLQRSAALAAGVLLSALASFQIALGLGAPLGDHVYGGRFASGDGKLPVRLRVGSVSSAALLIVVVWVLLARSRIVDARGISVKTLSGSVWAIAGLMALNTLGNLASRSLLEKWGFGSATALIAVLSALSVGTTRIDRCA